MELEYNTLGKKYLLMVDNTKTNKNLLFETLLKALEKDTTVLSQEFGKFVDDINLPQTKEVINLNSLKTKIKISNDEKRVLQLKEKLETVQDGRIKEIIDNKIDHIANMTLSPYEYTILGLDAYVKEGGSPQNFKTELKRHINIKDKFKLQAANTRQEEFAM